MGWLVLSRRAGESLKIGKDIEVSVSRITEGRVRLAVKGPKETKVLRGELDERRKDAA